MGGVFYLDMKLRSTRWGSVLYLEMKYRSISWGCDSIEREIER